jgi:uncharacterized protein (DUF2267 family)
MIILFVVFTALRVRMAKEVDPSVCAQIKPELRKIYGMQEHKNLENKSWRNPQWIFVG